MRAYLDYNATAPLRPEARGAVLATLDLFGNPSSVHAEGRAARALVEGARRDVAGLTGAAPRDVIFTASGTEAAALALAPGKFSRLIVGASEHVCVLAGHRFAQAETAPVLPDGRIDLDALARLLAEGPPALVALQGANNETGVVQPITEAAALVHAQGGLLICDAVQLAGRLPLVGTGADALIVSAHKLGGPKGVGALVLLRQDMPIVPLVRGGGQERGRRAGTENVAAIAGFGAAAKAVASGYWPPPILRDACLRVLREIAPDAIVFGEDAPRLPNTLAFAVPGVAAATLLMRLDLEGVAVSSGSACSSGKVAPSHVLAAMGVESFVGAGAIRVSLGWASSEHDVELFASALGSALKTLRRARPG